MSKADKMLLDLGFKQTEETLAIVYEEKDRFDKFRKIVIFNDCYYVDLVEISTNRYVGGGRVNKEEHLAIQEKLKEIGWFNE